MTLLNTLLETCATLTQNVANLEQDKIAQAIEITKLKQRVKRRMHPNRGEITELDADEDVTLEDVDAEDTDKAEPGKVEEVIQVVTATKLMTEVVTTATTTITAAQVPKAIIQDPKETATASVIVHTKVKSKDKGKGILIEEPTPLKRQVQIKHDEAYAKQLEAELNANINWDDVMEQNMAGFKMDFFKGMTYNDIRPIFEKHYNSIKDLLEKGEKEIEEEGNKRKGDSLNQDAAKRQRIDEEEEELKTHLQIIANDDDDVYTKDTPLALKV
nr:hypothetical protein [Tanacetum cinerariifolium]